MTSAGTKVLVTNLPDSRKMSVDLCELRVDGTERAATVIAQTSRSPSAAVSFFFCTACFNGVMRAASFKTFVSGKDLFGQVEPARGSRFKRWYGCYCADSTCGAALKSDGWKVLSEWGTVNRFGEGLIGSHNDFLAKGWFVPNDGSVKLDMVNIQTYDTDSQVMQWYASSAPRAAYEHFIPTGTTRVVVAFAGSSRPGSQWPCTASIYEHGGARIYSRTRKNDGFSPFPDPDIVEVDTSSGPARIRFEESLGICWTAYVLYDGPSVSPARPPTTQDRWLTDNWDSFESESDATGYEVHELGYCIPFPPPPPPSPPPSPPPAPPATPPPP